MWSAGERTGLRTTDFHEKVPSECFPFFFLLFYFKLYLVFSVKCHQIFYKAQTVLMVSAGVQGAGSKGKCRQLCITSQLRLHPIQEEQEPWRSWGDQARAMMAQGGQGACDEE